MKLRHGLLCALLLLLGGCVTYTYNGGSYHSADEALAAQQQFNDQTLAHVTRLKHADPGTALVILPSRSTIEANGVTRTGTPDHKVIDYVVTLLSNDYSYFPRYLEASGAFAKVENRVVDYPLREAHDAQGKYAAVVYLHMISPQQVGWFVLKPGAQAPTAVNFDTMAQAGAPRIDSWVKGVVEAGKGGTH